MIFRIPGPTSDQTPFADMHVWEWAKAQPRAEVTLANYIASLGFVVGTDRLTEAQYQTLNYAIDHFHRTYPHFGPRALTFAECFTESQDGFYVAGHTGRYRLAPMLADALSAAGWIYDVTPESTYFEITTGGILRATYQQILGSRPLCFITE